METSGINDTTVVDALQRHVATKSNAPAYRTGDKVLTFADVDRATNQIANALVAMQVGPGDRVACLTKHHTECLLLTLAACKLGAVCMPVNWRLAQSEVAHIV
jgi:long-chain acyl-CoA synthetase